MSSDDNSPLTLGRRLRLKAMRVALDQFVKDFIHEHYDEDTADEDGESLHERDSPIWRALFAELQLVFSVDFLRDNRKLIRQAAHHQAALDDGVMTAGSYADRSQEP